MLQCNIFNKFKRITSSGKFIPEVDGLRFIAITSVILYHIYLFFSEKNKHDYLDKISDHTVFSTVMSHGHYGVQLFFTISGFILALPFARHYLAGSAIPSIKQYFLRRVTRLEPPYFLAMIGLFLAHLFIVHKFTSHELIKSLAASLTYTHNFIYGRDTFPLINVVAWSLEIEVQFYIIAPLLALIFKLRHPVARRMIITSFVLILILLQSSYTPPFRSLYDEMQYFLIGFLLADFYISPVRLKVPDWLAAALGFILLGAMWCYSTEHSSPFLSKLVWGVLFPLIIFAFYYLVFFTAFWKGVFSNKILTTIGGMCYSIYLLHYAIISMIGNYTIRFKFTSWSLIDWAMQAALLIIFVLIISSIFFIWVERRCMEKDWYKRLFRKRLRGLSST